MQRRDFLKTMGAAGLVAGLGGFYFLRDHTPRSGLLLGGGRFVTQGQTQNIFSMVDMKTKRRNYVELGFLPHGVIVNPKDPSVVLTFEKIGPGACALDLKTGKQLRTIEPKSGYLFYGHGAFSPDGNLIYATETRTSDQSGAIVVRDAQTFDIVGEFPTFGENPHECILLGDGKTMLVTNGGGVKGKGRSASVTYIDVATRKLIRELSVKNEDLNAGHIAPFELEKGVDGSGLVLVSAPRRGLSDENLGGVSLMLSDGNLQSVREPPDIVQRMKGEALSVCIHHEAEVFAVTHPLGNLVTFWSLQDRRLMSALSIERPRGLALSMDRKAFVLSYGVQTEMVLIDVKTLSRIESSYLTNTGMAGSHLLNWDLEKARIAQVNRNST